ncbi:MAG: hypothetical protein ACI4C1_00640 [Lachnospiraceae bacterium]
METKSEIWMAGNLAPEEDPYEARRRAKQRRELERRNLADKTVKILRKRPPYHRPQFIPIILMLIVFMMLCLGLLEVEQEIMKTKKDIKALKNEYFELLEDNNAKELAMEEMIDLNEIYNRAIDELGMVYPKNDQIIVYDKSESGYVRQYDAIP